jgi:hypothetical protein
MLKIAAFWSNRMAVNALFMGVFTVFSSAALAQVTESAVVRLAQTGVDGNFTLALVSSSVDGAAQDLAALTSLCKQIRIFGRVEPNSSAAAAHATAMQALKQAASNQRVARFQFGSNAGLKVANKTVPCALRSHGLALNGDVVQFATKASVADKSALPAKPPRSK